MFVFFHATLTILADLREHFVDEEAVDYVELAGLNRIDRSFERSEILDGLVAKTVAFLVDVLDERDLVFEVRIVWTRARLVLRDLDLSFMEYVVVLTDVTESDDLLILFICHFL